MPLRLRSAGGGSVLLSSPAAQSTDVAMEVPAYDGAKLLTDKTPGTVIQTQYSKIANAPGSSSAWFTTTSTTAANSGLSVSITPKYASSKLLVQITGNLNINAPAVAGVGAQLWIYRDGANANSGGNNSCATFIYNVNTVDQYTSYSSSAYVNANSTNTTTFSLWAARWSSTETVRLGGHDGQTTILVMEIAA